MLKFQSKKGEFGKTENMKVGHLKMFRASKFLHNIPTIPFI
jgi:hypothetical protein